ncbi:unnamed protein product [Coccothraustes coccothraustes]
MGSEWGRDGSGMGPGGRLLLPLRFLRIQGVNTPSDPSMVQANRSHYCLAAVVRGTACSLVAWLAWFFPWTLLMCPETIAKTSGRARVKILAITACLDYQERREMMQGH